MVLTAGMVAACLNIIMNQRLAAAQLIVENQILHIQPAVFHDRDGIMKGNEVKSFANIEMYVSCFGILLGSKIIKFNQEGIRLMVVEIGRDYLSLDYGKDRDLRNIRLIYPRPDSKVLAGIVEKFRYETGIIPKIAE